MSMHDHSLHKDGKHLTISLGWDRSHQCFFMTVKEFADANAFASAGNKFRNPLYTNLPETGGGLACLDDCRNALKALDLTVPESVFTALALDAEDNVGDRMVTHVDNDCQWTHD